MPPPGITGSWVFQRYALRVEELDEGLIRPGHVELRRRPMWKGKGVPTLRGAISR